MVVYVVDNISIVESICVVSVSVWSLSLPFIVIICLVIESLAGVTYLCLLGQVLCLLC